MFWQWGDKEYIYVKDFNEKVPNVPFQRHRLYKTRLLSLQHFLKVVNTLAIHFTFNLVLVNKTLRF